MARVPVVSRTIKSTVVQAMAVDVETGEVLIKTYVLSRTYKNNDLILKKLRKLHETDTIKIVQIMEAKVEVHKYSMSEDTYIANATVVD